MYTLQKQLPGLLFLSWVNFLIFFRYWQICKSMYLSRRYCPKQIFSIPIILFHIQNNKYKIELYIWTVCCYTSIIFNAIDYYGDRYCKFKFENWEGCNLHLGELKINIECHYCRINLFYCGLWWFNTSYIVRAPP